MKALPYAFSALFLASARGARHIPSITPAKPGETNKRPGCDDEHDICGEWASSGECEANPGYMRLNCQKACGLCAKKDPSISRGVLPSEKVAKANEKAAKLTAKGEAIMRTDEPGAKVFFKKAVKLAPSQLALLQLGRMGMNSQDDSERTQAYAYLERSFDEDCFPTPVEINSVQGYYLSNLIARCT